MTIIKGEYFQVRDDNPNKSIVRVYDCSRNISPEKPCNFQNSPFVSLRPGDWYDMCERRQLPSAPSDNELNNPVDNFHDQSIIVSHSNSKRIRRLVIPMHSYVLDVVVDGNQIGSI